MLREDGYDIDNPIENPIDRGANFKEHIEATRKRGWMLTNGGEFE